MSTTTTEHLQPVETARDRSYPFGYNLNVLRAMRNSGEISSKGPRSADSPEHINPTVIEMALAVQWSKGKNHEAAVAIAKEMNKLAERGKVELTFHDSAALASEAARVATIAGYPKTASGARAVARLTVAGGSEYAEEYLGPAFVDELRELAGDDTELATTIEEYYTTEQRLRMAGMYREPMGAVSRAVERVVPVALDRRDYIRNITGSGEYDKFADELTDKLLLKLAEKSPESFDDLLARAAGAYETLRMTCPLMCEHKAPSTIGLLLDVGHKSYERLIGDMTTMEGVAARLVRDGMPASTATSIAFRTHGDESKTPVATARQVSHRLFGNYPTVNGTTELRDRMDAAYNRGVLTPEDAGAVLHGTTEYRDLLLRIDESSTLTDEEKHNIFAFVRQARESFALMMYRLESVVSTELADSMRQQFDQKLTTSLYGIRYVIDGRTDPQSIPMGSRVVEIADGKDGLMAAQSYLATATNIMNQLQTREDAVEAQANNLELATVPGSPSLLIMTKRKRAPVETGYEQGKGARICLFSHVDGRQPSLQAVERVRDSLCIRIDLDSDGMVRLDVGGKTDDPNTPDFMVARLLSLGEWYRAQLRGTEASDYHIDLMEMSEDQFAELVDRFRATVAMTPVVRAGELVRGELPVQDVIRTDDEPLSLQDRKPAA